MKLNDVRFQCPEETQSSLYVHCIQFHKIFTCSLVVRSHWRGCAKCARNQRRSGRRFRCRKLRSSRLESTGYAVCCLLSLGKYEAEKQHLPLPWISESWTAARPFSRRSWKLFLFRNEFADSLFWFYSALGFGTIASLSSFLPERFFVRFVVFVTASASRARKWRVLIKADVCFVYERSCILSSSCKV